MADWIRFVNPQIYVRKFNMAAVTMETIINNKVCMIINFSSKFGHADLIGNHHYDIYGKTKKRCLRTPPPHTHTLPLYISCSEIVEQSLGKSQLFSHIGSLEVLYFSDICSRSKATGFSIRSITLHNVLFVRKHNAGDIRLSV